MRKLAKIAALASLCVVALCLAVACSSPEVSRSSDEKNMTATEKTVSASSATDPTYVLLIGNDSRYKTYQDKGQSPDDPTYADTIMLMRLDPKANRVSIVSIPRDTAATVNGQPEKINAVHLAGGPEALAQEVGAMFGVEVPYYFDLKFIDYEELVDNLGGITSECYKSISGKDIVSGKQTSVEAGVNEMNGAEALLLARLRKVYEGNGEAIRQLNGRNEVANAIAALSTHPVSEAATFATLLGSVGESNMSTEQLKAYIEAFMNNADDIEINVGTTPYVGAIDDSGTWRVARDADACARLKDAMENGGDMSEIVTPPSVY